MEFVESPEVDRIIASYPAEASKRLRELRSLIVEVASETAGVEKLLETTKWGEPSYLVKGGSTIRMDWKEKSPDHYFIYFICSTQLVQTFKLMVGDELQYEGNRAIVLSMGEPLPGEALKRCLSLAMNYHALKHLPMLGI